MVCVKVCGGVGADGGGGSVVRTMFFPGYCSSQRHILAIRAQCFLVCLSPDIAAMPLCC